MNECMKHQQRYPRDGFCVYCGKPGEGLSTTPLPGPTTPIDWGTNSISVCGTCGEMLSNIATTGTAGSTHVCRQRVWVTHGTITGASVIGTPLKFGDMKTGE